MPTNSRIMKYLSLVVFIAKDLHFPTRLDRILGQLKKSPRSEQGKKKIMFRITRGLIPTGAGTRVSLRADHQLLRSFP